MCRPDHAVVESPCYPGPFGWPRSSPMFTPTFTPVRTDIIPPTSVQIRVSDEDTIHDASMNSSQ
ncbi:unnamed protein product [Leptidea sinapis]|uniref:Uncharacterized protein n=1 Tax=Leptidea sinapis TaxID=189913 RepID=A0A5E4QVS6_9NEOP|nr:unnamed protein product [Leptidea sinapis]